MGVGGSFIGRILLYNSAAAVKLALRRPLGVHLAVESGHLGQFCLISEPPGLFIGEIQTKPIFPRNNPADIFFIKTVLNGGLFAISFRKNRVKLGTVLIMTVLSGDPL